MFYRVPLQLELLLYYLTLPYYCHLVTGLRIVTPPPFFLHHSAAARWLRQAANKMAYNDPAFATEDAMRVGRLHTHLPGWADANVAFMRSGGYAISASIPQVGIRAQGYAVAVRKDMLWQTVLLAVGLQVMSRSCAAISQHHH